MKRVFGTLLLVTLVFACKTEPNNTLNTSKEPLSTEAEAKVVSWVGYKTFSFQLQEIAANFSKQYVVDNSQDLVSAANSLVYSMPNELRKEIMNEKASKVLKLTMALNVTAKIESEKAVKTVFKSLIDAYTSLNDEINYVSSRKAY